MITIESRQAQLAAMGVAQWYGRYTLLGAAVSPSRLYSIKEARALPVAVPELLVAKIASPERLTAANSQQLQAAPMNRLSEAGHVARTSPGKQVQSELSQPPMVVPGLHSVPAKLAALASKPTVLAVKCYRSGKILIFTETGRDESAELEGVLLGQILRVCSDPESGARSASGVPMHRVEKSFNWPVFGCANLLDDEQSLRAEFLARWLSSLLYEKVSEEQSQETEIVVYFGAVNEGLLTQLLGTVSAGAGLTTPLFITVGSSLAELLATPLKKAEVWQALLPYLLRLERALDQ